MKYRSGFVSNSSSASFIVAVKKLDACPTCHRSDENFLDLVETIGNNSGETYETTKLRCRGSAAIWSEKEEDIIPYCGDGEKNRLLAMKERMQEAEAKGYEVGEVEISYGDKTTDNIMRGLKERKALVVMWSDHYDVKDVEL
jgi:hypothetical protein